MSKFKNLYAQKAYNKEIEYPSVTVTDSDHQLFLRFDSRDELVEAGYTGEPDPWFSSLCSIMIGKTVNDLSSFTWDSWIPFFNEDQSFWDFRQEVEDQFFHPALELLRASLNILKGREDLYQDKDPLICRCFGVRESDILEHLRKESVPTLETLASSSKAGMGCRSCVPQIKRWLVTQNENQKRFYKDRPVADWLLEIDHYLSTFPNASEWKMELRGLKNMQVKISFEKEVSQKELEEVSKELQRFLGSSVDSDLAFLLISSRHFSKADE